MLISRPSRPLRAKDRSGPAISNRLRVQQLLVEALLARERLSALHRHVGIEAFGRLAGSHAVIAVDERQRNVVRHNARATARAPAAPTSYVLSFCPVMIVISSGLLAGRRGGSP